MAQSVIILVKNNTIKHILEASLYFFELNLILILPKNFANIYNVQNLCLTKIIIFLWNLFEAKIKNKSFVIN